MNEESHADVREDDQAERQFDDGLAILEQLLAGNALAIEEQQRWQE